MITILYYLVKVILCSVILYTYYWFVLRNKQFHQYNRFYLMGISVLSWLVPLIKIEIIKEQAVAAPKVLNFVDLIAEKNSSIEQEVITKSSQFAWDNLLIIIAIAISLFFLLSCVKSLWNIKKLLRQYPLKKLEYLNLVMTDVKGTPFSFFKYIFWNISIDLNSEVGKKILAHEVAHIEENHSFDKLLIELQLVIGWFNPITWLIRNELYLIHEFIADQKSIQNNDTSILAELLLTSAYPAQQHILSNPFFYSPIKRRIQMFTKSKSIKYSYLRRLSILPIMAATVLLFAFRNGNININTRPIIKLDKQYTVIIDAGHGGEDLGGIATDGTTEKDLALAIALKVKSLNNNPNINIILSRESDKFINVVDRANFANTLKANLLVSIHIDNAATSKSNGTTCYVPSKKNLYVKESNFIAKNILSATSELFPKGKIATREKGIWVIENTNMPAVLFESGFISNPNDLKLVKENEEKIASMLLDGINSYLFLQKNKSDFDTLSKVKLGLTKSNKIIVKSKSSFDTLEVGNYISKNIQKKYSNVILTTKDKQIVLDALEKKASVVITKKTKSGEEKYMIVDNEKAANKPDFYINGEKVTEAEMKSILPNQIESVVILRGDQAIKKYLQVGKNGVVEISLKNRK